MENHSDLSKNFIPYDLALELKELGFDGECFGFYDLSYKCRLAFTSDQNFYEQQKCSAPTFSQAFRFFREKYNFVSEINVYSTSDGYSFSFKILCKKYTPYIEANNAWILYEEAELTCIRKLIEIAKEQNVK